MAARSWVVAALVAATGVTGWGQDKKAVREVGQDHLREELGVNPYTTPSIELMLSALQDLRPLPYDAVSRDVPTQFPADRPRLALGAGGLIADGFLAVAAEKQSRLEPIGRALLRQARGLGVADYVSRHSKSILEYAARKQWDMVRGELIGAQRDVEKGMMALKDEEMAHLVALGGWWRGLEIASGIVAESYTPERAALLVQPGVIDYFADRVGTLHPSFKKTKLWAALDQNLRGVRELSATPDQKPPTVEAVKKMQALARAVNQAIVTPEE